ncbi:MmgE/PrpD family protein [Alicyclobacillus dauci]|uniref:MmgE/PrpD family protein n=1 Tax=Alicyclobacillus dauci TaxID=1475485 RepID=A0ABY6Z2L6_9BACL|nr:MmgE/PrpD family protein [Alicyclobacillus dauci]WAH37137.1 MmgE/PrpD family protein [Alicyclobacillus dauci]
MARETEHLAEYIVHSSHQVFKDSAVLKMAQEALWDWIGCTVAGAAESRVEPLFTLLDRYPMLGRSVVVGRRQRVHPLMAALLNGAASHVLELDDVERTAYLHPGITPISAAFAALSIEPNTSDREFLRAIIAGYEVGIHVGRSVNPSHYRLWHTSGTAGAFGAAAAAAVILGLNVQQTMWALGNAGTEAAGLWQFNLDGALTKPYHIGMASLHGLLAALAAKEGLTGPHRILEGDQGFLRAMSDSPRPLDLVEGLDTGRPAILGISRKRWASCRFTHAPIDAVVAIRGRQREGVAVERIVVETFATAIRVAGHSNPETPQEAKFSIAYCCALAWLIGSVGIQDFEVSHCRSDVNFNQIFSKVEVVHDSTYDDLLPDYNPARVTVFWNDGTLDQQEVLHPIGDPECPITDEILDEKVASLLRAAGMSSDNIRDLRNVVRTLGIDEGSSQLEKLVELI